MCNFKKVNIINSAKVTGFELELDSKSACEFAALTETRCKLSSMFCTDLEKFVLYKSRS